MIGLCDKITEPILFLLQCQNPKVSDGAGCGHTLSSAVYQVSTLLTQTTLSQVRSIFLTLHLSSFSVIKAAVSYTHLRAHET